MWRYWRAAEVLLHYSEAAWGQHVQNVSSQQSSDACYHTHKGSQLSSTGKRIYRKRLAIHLLDGRGTNWYIGVHMQEREAD